ncbi:MAG: transposase [Deltaproteobacteria bacterium]|nr:transposase [Deltaproteobacteria bacterium]
MPTASVNCLFLIVLRIIELAVARIQFDFSVPFGDGETPQRQFRAKHLWARGYLVVSSGTVTDEMIREYMDHTMVLKSSF